MSLEDNRREYKYGRLTRESLREDPFDQFQLWMDQAIESGIQDPTAMSIATVDKDGSPWQRMVLLKGFNNRGFVFYTNLGSRKSGDIAGNPHVVLLFPWLQLDRQVIVGGIAEKLSIKDVLGYFLKRPRDSQLAAWASRQSSRLNSRQALESQYLQMQEKFKNGSIPLPDFWGGYRVLPQEFEFWQGGEHRLHDRFQYLKRGNSWAVSRLAP